MSARLNRRARHWAVAVGVVAVFAMGAAAYAAIPNADGNIYACYSNGDGSVRVQSDPAKPCAKNWSPLKWPATQPTPPTTYWERVTVTIQPDENEDIRAHCDEGDVATGGGFSASAGGRTFKGHSRALGQATSSTGCLAAARLARSRDRLERA